MNNRRVVLERYADETLDVGRTLHAILLLEKDGNPESSEFREKHTPLQHDVLACPEGLLVRTISAMPLVVRCCEDDTEPHLPGVILKLLYYGLALRGKLI